MKQIWIPKYGPPSVLEVREAEDVQAGPGQLRIQVRAAGVNFADLMARMGMYPDGPPAPCVVGYEVSGIVDQVGEGAEESWLGVAVMAGVRFGGYSTQVVVNAETVVRKPASMSFEQAAGLPVVGLTAWMMLEEMHRVRAGDRVLVHSAGGSVGLMACDLLKYRGATAVGTASKRKHAFLVEWGYDQLIDYRSEDYVEQLKDGPKFDLILDPLGGDHWKKGLSLLSAGGKIACFGMSVNAMGRVGNKLSMLRNILKIPWWSMSPPSLINNNLGVLGVNMGRMWNETARLGAWLASLVELFEAGKVRSHVHASVPFSEAAQAHELLHSRENIGKVVLVPDEE